MDLHGTLQEYITHTNPIKYMIYINGSTLQYFPSPTIRQPKKNMDFYQCFSFHFSKLSNLVINNFLQYLLYCKTLSMCNIHIHLM